MKVTFPQQMTVAEQAAIHIYRRVQSDSNFAWLMLGTESLWLCIQAVAKCFNESESTARKFVEDNAASLRDRPEVLILRDRLERLEAQLEGRESIAEATASSKTITRQNRTLAAIEELVRHAELGYDVLTVEAVRDALDGRMCGAK